ncbi:MAG: hypothetical protein WCD66_14865, partial [Rhodanobacteraceae bacterium]
MSFLKSPFMKKLLFIPLLFLLLATNLFAQHDWQWGQEVRINAEHIAVDNYGNSYVTWTLEDPYEIDGELFISNGSYDIALTSFDCDGNHRWTKIIGGTGSDVVKGLGTDTIGGVYIAVSANAVRLPNYSTHFDSDTTINTGQKGMLLVKYNTEGDFQWLRMPEDSVIFNLPDDLQIGAALDLDVASNGDCYIYSRLFPGMYGGGAFEASYDATLQDGEDIYALKYNSNGNCTGGVHFDMYYSGGTLVTSKRTHDPYTGKFYMSGYLSDDNNIAIFGGEQVTARNYVVQFDSSGFVNWVISTEDTGATGTTGSRFFGKPSVDELGNVYVTGGSGSGFSFGDFTFQNTLGPQGFPIFAKIDSTGNVVYATNASGINANSGDAVVYKNNTVGVAGHWGGLLTWGDLTQDNTGNGSQGYNVFLAFFDASGDGMPQSFHSLTSTPLGVEVPSLLVADNHDNFYVGGRFSSQLYVGEDTIYNQTGTQEGFIAKFGSDSCYCPLPVAVFSYDTIPNEAGYSFAYSGTAEVDSVVWDFGDGET